MSMHRVCRRNIIRWVWIPFVVLGCNEVDVPDPPMQAEPVFSLQLDIDGSSTNLAAGRDNYFMHADYEIGQDDVVKLVGILRPDDCQDLCARSMRFIMSDVTRYSIGRFEVDRILKRGILPYAWDVDPDQVRVHLLDKSMVTASADLIRTWEYIGKTTHDTAVAFTTRKEDMPRVCLSLKTPNDDWQSTFCRVVRPGKNNNCKALIHFTLEDRVVVLTVRGDVDASKIVWSNGSTETSIKVKYEAGAFYSVELKDSSGCDIQIGLRFGRRQINEMFHSFFTVETGPVRSRPEMNLGTVRLDYKNIRGELFSTKFFRQPNDSFFEIVSVSDFDNTTDGKKTKKLGIRFSCLLYNEFGDRIKMNNARGQIAVAYPD